MLVVDFDPSRRPEQGQFHVRIIDGRSGDYGNDAQRQSQLGYWCDLGHLRSGVLASVEAAIKAYENHRRCESAREMALDAMRLAMAPRLRHVVPPGEPNAGARSYEQPGLDAALDALCKDKRVRDALVVDLCNCRFTRGQGWRTHEHDCFGVRATWDVLAALTGATATPAAGTEGDGRGPGL